MYKADEKLTSLITEFIDWLAYEKNYSDKTITAYSKDISSFLAFFNKYFGEIITVDILESLELSDIRAWLAEQKKQQKATSSVARFLSSIRSFLKYLDRFHKIVNGNFQHISAPKIKNILPRALSEEDALSSIDLIGLVSNIQWISARDEAILYLIYGSGLRISEALSIKISGIGRDSLTILGKGKKERIVPLLPEINEKIEKYLSLCPYHLSSNDFLFIGKNGKQLHQATFRKQLINMRRSYGIEEGASPHAFRHSFATHILSNGADLRSVQELLGHKNLSTTQRYTKIDINRLLSSYQNAHPKEKK